MNERGILRRDKDTDISIAPQAIARAPSIFESMQPTRVTHLYRDNSSC